jgi:hypothetical protein
MAMPDPGVEPIDWSLTTWEGARREQLRRWAQLSLAEIVAAQEEMQELAEWLSASRTSTAPEKKGTDSP